MRVIGLDLSLTSTGVSDGRRHFAIETDRDDQLEKRFDDIVMEINPFFRRSDPEESVLDWTPASLVVIEGPAFSKQLQPGHEELSGLRGLVRYQLWRAGYPFAIVPPTTLKAYTTGYGKASKAQMYQACQERHGLNLKGVKVAHGRDDMVDAFALAAMGYARLGKPLPTQGPPPPMKSLLAVDWPV